LTVLAVLASVPGLAQPKVSRPPVAAKHPHPTRIHGETLRDDYFWLRRKGTPEVERYLNAELAYAMAFMKPTEALQQTLYDEMLSRIQQTDSDVPFRERGDFYCSRTEENKQYPIHARRRGSLEAPEEVTLDVNELAAGKKFMAVDAMVPSPDGRLLAYTTDDTGFRQYVLHVKDLASGGLRSETAERVTSVEWSEDGTTLFYSVEDPQTKRSSRIFRMRLGGKAEPLYEEKDERFEAYVSKSRDRKFLFLELGSLTTSEVRYLPADQPAAQPKLLAAREPEQEYFVEHGDGLFWIRSNDKGRNFRLVTAPDSDPGRANWKQIVAHRDDVMLEDHAVFKDFYVLYEREGGLPQLRITELASGQSHRVTFPEEAYQVTPAQNREFDARLFRFKYQSPVTSVSTYDYDPFTRERKMLKQVAVPGGFDPARYRVEWTHAVAQDGVKVPIWLVYRKDLMKKDGTNPAHLYAYGSYGSASSAAFNPNIFSLVDRGVTHALAYIRGGGELGKKWHDDGRMLKKKNTFTDFIAAAEHLVNGKYTSSDRLAIQGASAGGLLMGAVTNMRPDLFKVVVARVPFVDVINTMLDETVPLTVSEFEEWGNPKLAEQYRYMRSYSPYDNIEAKRYPVMLVKSSYNDSQVMYWEPAKYVARLRASKTDSNPLVFQVNMDPAGHGGKSGRYDKLRETAFDYAFILWQLGIEA
jgi:oligopeptidase B